MGIDWSNAPEGATHWGLENDDWFSGWYKNIDDEWFYSKGGLNMGWASVVFDPDRMCGLIKRPPRVDWYHQDTPDWATHALTTGPEWSGDKGFIGKVVFDTLQDDGQGEMWNVGNNAWIILSERPKTTVEKVRDECLSEAESFVPKESPIKVLEELSDKYSKYYNDTPSAHYDKYMYRVRLTTEDCTRGFKDIKLDPYRVGKVCNVGGGALEQCLKKSMRGTDKGHDMLTVLKEIKRACERGIEMIEEDSQ